jgi:hypothetical protein
MVVEVLVMVVMATMLYVVGKPLKQLAGIGSIL